MKLLDVINTFKIKELLNVPNELNDIYNLCKNEIELLNEDLLPTRIFTVIYTYCLLSHLGYTEGNVDIISAVRNNITLSQDPQQAKNQYKQITKPTHIIPAVLLKMINDVKKYEVSNTKDIDNGLDLMFHTIQFKLTGKTYRSNYSLKGLLNTKITVQ